MEKFDVTICIPVFNGEEYLNEVIKKILAQDTKYSFEILVIDSGSKDRSVEICSGYERVRLHQIPNSEFGHGKTRNLAVGLCDSPYIVFLTQDATPENFDWLNAMVEPFELFDQISCVFGKQVPRDDCVVTVKREITTLFNAFGDDSSLSIQRHSDLTRKYGIANVFLSDVNSAFRRERLIEVPFRDINYAEDQAVAIDHLNHGWMKAYAPLGSVLHSHNYSPAKFFRRKIDEIIGEYEATGARYHVSMYSFFIRLLTSTIKDWRYIHKDKKYTKSLKIKNFFLSPIYNFLWLRAFRVTKNPAKHDKARKYSLEKSLRE